MRIAIVGAGVIGVTTAYELAADGHDVTVFELHGTPAEEASFAHAGLVAPGWLAASRAALGGPDRLSALPWTATGRWLGAWRRAGKPAAWQSAATPLNALAQLGRERMQRLMHDLRLACDSTPGALVLLRSDKDLQALQAQGAFLLAAQVRHQWLAPAEALKLEPALDGATPLAGALHLPDDETVNCRQFTVLLRKAAQALGVHFVFQARVAPLEPAAPTRLLITTPSGEASAAYDAVVNCGGAQADTLMRPLGLRLPLLTLQGQSITAPLGEPLNAPSMAVIDAATRTSITRVGGRLRVAGGIRLAGASRDRRPNETAALYRTLRDWFPAGARLSGASVTVQEWQGRHALLPDGLPAIGPSGVPGVWINLGHGGAGWTLACSSARLLADRITGRAPALDPAGFDPSRLQR